MAAELIQAGVLRAWRGSLFLSSLKALGLNPYKAVLKCFERRLI
jgi:hypothetical protein